jgi:hypothetical protein
MNFVTRLHRFIPRLSRSRLPAMSFQSAVANLSPPIKELVVAVTDNGIRYVGESAQDQTEVTEWIEKAEKADVASEPILQVCGAINRTRDLKADE